MRNPIPKLLLAVSCLAFSANALAQELTRDAGLPAIPKGLSPMPVGDTGEVILFGIDSQHKKWKYFYQRWNPGTGELRTLPLPPDVDASLVSVVATAGGLLFFQLAKNSAPGSVVFLTPQNKTIAATLLVKRDFPQTIVLSDQSVLLVGGKLAEGDGKQHTNAVERISLAGGKLNIDRLPDLPGIVRGGYSVVALADGRAMVLGGTDSQYLGMGPLADTYFLDIRKKAWSTGPKMIEPRSNASATLLSDGSVLVAGGWTPGHDWSTGPARSTERWNPRSNSFSPGTPLITGVALHQAVWVAGQRGKQLLIGGNTAAVQTYDVASDSWRLVGESREPALTHDPILVPFGFNKRPYLWLRDRLQPFEDQWTLVALRLPPSGPDTDHRVDTDKGIALKRSGSAFLPAQDGNARLIVAGSLKGIESYYISAAVDAIWPDGRIEALLPLNDARRDAQVFSLPDGAFLVVGGTGGKANDHEDQRQQMPMECLSGKPVLSQSRWVTLDTALPKGTIWGQLADGSLIAVKPDGEVENPMIAGRCGGKASAQHSALPPLNRKRKSQPGKGGMVVKGLPDGRIIVAGGDVQVHNIAVLQENSMQPSAPDKYIGIGDYLPSRRHEIYEPATKTWRTSSPSRGAGGPVAILDDGRVVKLGTVTVTDSQKKDGAATAEQREEGILEISTADGGAWSTLNAKAPSLVALNRDARPFVIQGELFLSGIHLTDVTPDYARGNQMVQRFNNASQGWETVWQAAPTDDNWRDHLGRIIIRELANGKRVVLPVDGL